MKKTITILVCATFISMCWIVEKNTDRIVGANPTEDEFIVQLEQDLVAEQVEWKMTHDRYKTKAKEKKLPYELETWTDSIVVWDGHETPKEVGYQIYIKKSDGGIKSFGNGILNNERSHNWEMPATTTPWLEYLKSTQ